MVQDKIAALSALGPVELGTIGVLVASLLLATVLSVIIKRRARGGRARRQDPARTLTRAQVMAPSRSTTPSKPGDMQERLRRLTVGASAPRTGDGSSVPVAASGSVTSSSVASDRGATATPATSTQAPVSHVAPSDDATRFFGNGAAGMDNAASADATTFFAEPDAPIQGDDATRFFADTAAPDATTFFGEEPAPAPAGPAPAALPERDDATRFFGSEGADAADAADHDRTGFLPPSETRFFAPDELEGGAANGAADGHTGMLRALPSATNATKDGMWDTAGAQPLAVGDTGSLSRVRECLAAVSAPEVMALSVIDGAGRVLAGETDADLTGELRSLMAESGQGNTADIEQPVRLSDDATGAILLLPTGANALLGALVRDADDPQATRHSLRAVAHTIGDAIRCAS